MIDWLINWIKHKIGHWLIADEEADEQRRDQEIARKQKDIIDANYSTEDTARDLDDGRF